MTETVDEQAKKRAAQRARDEDRYMAETERFIQDTGTTTIESPKKIKGRK